MSRHVEKPQPRPMTAWLMQAIGPVLIILFLGSFVYLLVLVFYWGPHTNRLQWILGLFVAAAVLVSRISIELGRERAFLYLIPLALATMMTTSALVQFDSSPALGLAAIAVMIGLGLWLADRLTWDATVIDASRDASAQGLLMGLRPSWLRQRDGRAGDEANPSSAGPPRSDAQAGNLLKYLFLPGHQANTPGLWVLYIGLFTLPMFAIGQWFVPADYPGGFRYVKWLFAVHVGAGLALMMTTSLLGLQRYLNQRRIALSGEVTRSWLIAGGAVVVVVLMFIWLVPQFQAQSRFQGAVSWLTAKERSSSRGALGRDGVEKRDEGNSRIEDDNGSGRSSGGLQSGGQSNSRGKQEAGTASGRQGQASRSSTPSTDSKQNAQNQQNAPHPNGAQSPAAQNEQVDPKANHQSDDRAEPNHQKSDDDERAPADDEKTTSKDSNSSGSPRWGRQDGGDWGSNRPASDVGRQPPRLPEISERAGQILKWLGIFALLAAMIVFRKELLAAWRELMELLSQLFGGKSQRKQGSATAPTEERLAASKKYKRFAEYPHPFATQLGLNFSQLVVYSFAAVEAFAREAGIPRRENETPHEFCARLAQAVRQLHPDVLRLSDAYCQVVFSERVADSRAVDLRVIWDTLIHLYERR